MAAAADRRAVVVRGTVGALLLLVGLAALGGWRVLSGIETQPFAIGANPPATVHVTQGKTYSLAVPGGVGAMERAGVATTPTQGGSDQLSLECGWSVGGAVAQSLTVTPEHVDTKAETTVGHFVAPATGNLRITCAHWGAMYVPDSDDRSADGAGWLLLVSTITLTIGGALALSAGYAVQTARRARSVATPREDDDIERLVHVVKVRSDDGEVGDHDGLDGAR